MKEINPYVHNAKRELVVWKQKLKQRKAILKQKLYLNPICAYHSKEDILKDIEDTKRTIKQIEDYIKENS
jgi:hypothetical protein